MLPRLLPLLLALPLAAQEPIPVSGVVRHSVTGNPLGNVLLSLTRTDKPAPEYSVTSPADGRFAFQVPPGVYRLMAESPVYGGQVYGAASFQSGAGIALRLAPGARPAPLDFRLIPPAALSGLIRDPYDEPVENALVQLLQLRLVDGRQRLAARATVYSDDRGYYRISNLAPGPYYLMVSATPWHTTHAAPAHGQSYFRPRFYPAAATPDGASALHLTAGQEARADFALEEGEAPEVELSLMPPPPQGSNLTLQLRAPGLHGLPRFQRIEYVSGSPHVLTGNPPGEYEVVVIGNAGAKGVRGVARFTLGNANLPVTVPLTPPPTLAGRLDCAGSASRSSLFFVEPAQGGRVPATLQPDGSFVTTPVNPGVYSVLLNSPDCYVHRLTVAGQPVPGNRLPVGAESLTGLVVEAKADAGSLHGILRRGDTAQPGVKVYLAPLPLDDSRPCREYLTDSDGSFDFVRLPPGRYMAYVAPDALELFEYGNPEAVARYQKNATFVEIAPQQRTRLDLAWPGPANGQAP
jgi:hypothetical protein